MLVSLVERSVALVRFPAAMSSCPSVGDVFVVEGTGTPVGSGIVETEAGDEEVR